MARRGALLLWEDAYYDKLQVFIRRCRHALGGPPDFPIECETVLGLGNFKRAVREHLYRRPPRHGEPFHFVVAVADADRWAQLVPGAPAPTGAPSLPVW